MTRRLPVYLVLDCSESMAGPAIEEVARGVETLVSTLRANPQALETAYLSVITFSHYAKQVTPLTDIVSFQPPKLAVRTGTALGAALTLLQACMQREIVQTSPTAKGDYKPLVFLLTDGQPTDDWEPAADALRAANRPRIANIYAIGCGPDVDHGVLRRVTDIVLNMPELSTEAFRKAFVWLSASVQSASVRFYEGDRQAPLDMPRLPEGLAIAPSTPREPHEAEPRQVFLHARCSRTRQPYLMRFARRYRGGRYEAIASHPLEEIEEGDAELLPPINSAMLDGCPSCPYCGNPVAAACPCGGICCSRPTQTGSVTCPACEAQLTDGGAGSFDIRRAAG